MKNTLILKRLTYITKSQHIVMIVLTLCLFYFQNIQAENNTSESLITSSGKVIDKNG